MRAGPAWPLLACVLVATLGACSRLPDVATVVAAASGRTTAPAVIGPRAPLSPQRDREVLQQLVRAHADRTLLARELPVAAAISSVPLTTGNRVTLIEDGPDIEEAIRQAIAGARDHVNVETYILADDEVGQRFADLLVRKRREGVPVAVMYDSFASFGTPKAFFDRLRHAGIEVLEFNPLDPLRARAAWSPNRRDHRKLFIVDGTTAILGGANIEHPSAVEGETYWRDTDVRIDGPAVAQLQALFIDAWQAQHGEPLAAADYFPRAHASGDAIVRVLAGPDPPNPIYATLVSALMTAKRSVHLTTPYFVPDPQLLGALEAAARRGVDVELILPGFSDFPPALAAGRAHYERLLAAGAAIYERQHAWLHAKTAVIDGVWSTVGSTNLDRRSFLFNQEVNAIVLGAEFAQRMEQAFARDRAASRRIAADAWHDRPVSRRTMEWIADLFGYWW